MDENENLFDDNGNYLLYDYVQYDLLDGNRISIRRDIIHIVMQCGDICIIKCKNGEEYKINDKYSSCLNKIYGME